MYDYIIVGAGSAGCVLANRLSADPRVNVLLLEAAPDSGPGPESEDIVDTYPLSSYNSAYFWPEVKAYWRNRRQGTAVKFSQARVMGGGSAVAGTVASRGTAADYDEWRASGLTGWGWSDVLPYFCRLECDQDFQGAAHGAEGPMPIRRIPASQWPPLTQAIARYAKDQGHAFIEDMNADFRDGFGATPISSKPDRRITTAAGYLDAKVRARPNLTIRTQVEVRDLTWEGRRVTGVSAIERGTGVSFQAREVIVATGTIHSPALLQRSGIGDGALLQGLGIDVVAHRPGVGRNLQNHAVIFFGALLKRGSRQEASLNTHPTACLRLSSGVAGAYASNLYINIQSKTSWNAMGRRLASLNAVLQKPRGCGQVQITSASAERAPVVEFGFGDHQGDLQALSRAVVQVIDLMASPQVASLMGKPFVVRVGDRIRKWNAHTTSNALRASAFAALLDLVPSPVADALLARMTGQPLNGRELKDEALFQFVQREVAGVYHPVGTCRMGTAGDSQAVVDGDGRVIGVEGLRVADASVMPTLPRGNTNIPTIMVAEKLSDHILGKFAGMA